MKISLLLHFMLSVCSMLAAPAFDKSPMKRFFETPTPDYDEIAASAILASYATAGPTAPIDIPETATPEIKMSTLAKGFHSACSMSSIFFTAMHKPSPPVRVFHSATAMPNPGMDFSRAKLSKSYDRVPMYPDSNFVNSNVARYQREMRQEINDMDGLPRDFEEAEVLDDPDPILLQRTLEKFASKEQPQLHKTLTNSYIS